jgi:outer membrane protein assembly factor BamA
MLDTIDPAFREKIESSSYLAYSYRDVTILGSGYSLVFSNQTIKKSRDFWFFRFNAETSGNLLEFISTLAGQEKKDGSYNVFGRPFAQYIRADLDLRYNLIINDVSSVVYRGFIGAAIPYGNSQAIPFEKQYFGGGANGIRAWQVRTLGPGSHVPDRSSFLNQTADIKLETNIEYRFKLFWILESAFFVDAGNIWSYRDNSIEGAQFHFRNVMKDMAVGTGIGLRFNLDFVLIRADAGMKLRDPSLPAGSKWISNWKDYSDKTEGGKIFTFVLGIGYPF